VPHVRAQPRRDLVPGFDLLAMPPVVRRPAVSPLPAAPSPCLCRVYATAEGRRPFGADLKEKPLWADLKVGPYTECPPEGRHYVRNEIRLWADLKGRPLHRKVRLKADTTYNSSEGGHYVQLISFVRPERGHDPTIP
jgi:hypothetical protein